MNIFGAISKTEEQDDGSIKVWGFASSGCVDSDGETITPEAMKAALPGYMEWANVREMHGNNAAGTAIEASVQEDGKTFFGAHVIDPVAVKKIKANVYKGFSIGGKVLSRDVNDRNIVTGIKLVEVSLVDRPANPEAKFTVVKAEELDKSSEIDNNKEMDINKEEVAPAIVEEVKSEVVAEPVVKAEEVKTEEIAKSLSDTAWLSIILQDLNSLRLCLESEKDWEGDDSKVPADLKAAIKTLSNILVASVKEEAAELTNDPESDNILMADATVDLNKSGARNSKTDSDKIQKIHDLVLELGAQSPSNITEVKADKVEDLKKFADVEDALNKVSKEKDELQKRVTELEAMPKPAKGVLLSVAKSEDSLGLEDKKISPVFKMGTQEEDPVATAIKKAQQTGQIIRL